MITLDIAKQIQDDINVISADLGHDIVFIIKDDTQRYDTRMITRDGKTYQPCVLSLSSNPVTLDELQLTQSSYRLFILGETDKRREIEQIFYTYQNRENKQSIINNKVVQIYSSNLFKDDFIKSEDGQNLSKIIGRVEIETYSTAYDQLSGFDTTLKIDNTIIPFNLIRYRKDKSLISNVNFGNNNIDIKLVNEELQIEIPIIEDNVKIMELLNDTLNNNYNKSYQLIWKIGNLEATMDMTLRVATIDYNRNNNPLTFWVTLQRTLSRKDFKIDGVTIPAIRWAYNGNVEITSKSASNGVKSKIIGVGRSVSALLLNDNSLKVNEIIDAIDNHDKNKRFNVSMGINAKTLTYSMIVKEGNIQVTENPDLMLEVTFIEGV